MAVGASQAHIREPQHLIAMQNVLYPSHLLDSGEDRNEWRGHIVGMLLRGKARNMR